MQTLGVKAAFTASAPAIQDSKQKCKEYAVEKSSRFAAISAGEPVGQSARRFEGSHASRGCTLRAVR
jgi:hypothetical protein